MLHEPSPFVPTGIRFSYNLMGSDDVILIIYFSLLQTITYDVSSRIAPCCNGSSDGKFPIGRSGDGARWDGARRATGRAGDGGAAGDETPRVARAGAHVLLRGQG